MSFVTKRSIWQTLIVIALIMAVGYIFTIKFVEYQETKATDLSATINSSFANGTQFGIDNLAIYLVQNNEFPKLKFSGGNYSGFDLIDLNKYCDSLE